MNFNQFCKDYYIQVAPIGHKHKRIGWINIECPFCTGNPGYHLGYQESGAGGFVCYRCGGHSAIQVIAVLARVTRAEAADLIKEYGGKPYAIQHKHQKQWKLNTSIMLPKGTMELDKQGRNYLKKRNFDPDLIKEVWGIKQTGPVFRHKYRIVIPINFLGFTISYTCRSYVHSELRYLSCAEKDEAIPHKSILYGIDEVPGSNRLVVVEGCTDVWRLGPGACATFGTAVSAAQLKLMCNFRRVIFLQDADNAGQLAAQNVLSRLRFAGIDVVTEKVPYGKDAGDLSDTDARHLMKIL